MRNHALYHTIDVIDYMCQPIFNRIDVVNRKLRELYHMRFRFNFNYQIEPFGERGRRMMQVKFMLETKPDDPLKYDRFKDSIYTSIFHVGGRHWDEESITHILRSQVKEVLEGVNVHYHHSIRPFR